MRVVYYTCKLYSWEQKLCYSSNDVFEQKLEIRESTLKVYVLKGSAMVVMVCWCYTYTISVGSPVSARWACSGSFQFLNRTTLLTATRSGYSKPWTRKIVSLVLFLLRITMYVHLYILHLNASFYHHVSWCCVHNGTWMQMRTDYAYSLYYFNSSYI